MVYSGTITLLWTQPSLPQAGQGFTKKTELLCQHPLRLEDHPLHLLFHESQLYLLVLPSCHAALSMVRAEVEAGTIESLRVEKTSQDHQVQR